ncbi:MAG: hypothetical protein PHT12_01395 [Patescibacteria group bacterium]|nr:hypothetical protein [Patescibacteria group bacterium]
MSILKRFRVASTLMIALAAVSVSAVRGPSSMGAETVGGRHDAVVFWRIERVNDIAGGCVRIVYRPSANSTVTASEVFGGPDEAVSVITDEDVARGRKPAWAEQRRNDDPQTRGSYSRIVTIHVRSATDIRLAH